MPPQSSDQPGLDNDVIRDMPRRVSASRRSLENSLARARSLAAVAVPKDSFFEGLFFMFMATVTVLPYA